MFLFQNRTKLRDVHRLIIAIVNHNCELVDDVQQGARTELRVRLTRPVQLVPLQGDRPRFDRTFAALTKEFSTAGLSLATDRPLETDAALLGLAWEERMYFLRAKVKHQDPLGAGFWTVGLELTEVIDPEQWRELANITI